MRLKIRHTTTYTYATPARRAVELLRLTPRGHDGQFVIAWRIDVDQDCTLFASTDPFGNPTHNFTAEGPFDSMTITAEGTVETTDTAGVLRGQVERFPAQFFLRDTELTTADAALRDLAGEVGEDGDRIALLHRLMGLISERMRFEEDRTDAATSAAEALRLGHGVCQDFAHVFIAAARHIGIPARYVSGYLLHGKGNGIHRAGHAWAEAEVEGLGWVGFDAANNQSPTDGYVRVACALDGLGAAPVRGMTYGSTGETLAVAISVEKAFR